MTYLLHRALFRALMGTAGALALLNLAGYRIVPPSIAGLIVGWVS